MDPIPTDEIPTSLYSHLARVDWNEPWVYCVIAMHVAILVVVVAFRTRLAVQGPTFFMMLIMVYFAENLNEYLRLNYKLYSKNQYFDSNGLFISLIMSLPFLFFSALLVFNWFLMCADLMAQLRISRLKERREVESKKEQ